MLTLDNYVRRATVKLVHDGDTVLALVDLGYNVMTVAWIRLRGVFADENKEQYGTQHREITERVFTPGRVFNVQTYKVDSKHDWTIFNTTLTRYVGECWSLDGSSNLNKLLIASGIPDKPKGAK